MKKLRIFPSIFLFGSLCLISCGPSLDSLRKAYAVGNDFRKISSEQKNNDSFFEFENYCFWSEGKYDISIHCDSLFEFIDANQFTTKKTGKSSDLNEIQEGDDVFKVVAAIGIPTSCGTSGVESLLFHLNDANGCRIYFYNENTFLKVHFIEIF